MVGFFVLLIVSCCQQNKGNEDYKELIPVIASDNKNLWFDMECAVNDLHCFDSIRIASDSVIWTASLKDNAICYELNAKLTGWKDGDSMQYDVYQKEFYNIIECQKIQKLKFMFHYECDTVVVRDNAGNIIGKGPIPLVV